MSDSKAFYITTPIYYVNDKPHIGHAYTTILADVIARFQRAQGRATFFLTGTDEHGQKVQQAAQAVGIDPQIHCDRMVAHFQQAWQKLEITHDFFIRTTDDFHKKTVQAVLQDLWDRDEIYEHEYGGYYCVGCERFYTPKELIDGKCPQHQQVPEYIKEKNYFFKMSKYQAWLIEYIRQHPEFIQPETRRNEVLGFLKSRLEDLCISRPKSRLSWGIELPFDSQYVTYVWFDALLNYVSAIGYKQDDAKFQRWWPADYHLIGKDIVTTHCVYWPTMLKAAGIPLPKTILAHGWWMVDATKMSKSLKNIIKPLDLIDKYGVDPVRYFLIRDMVLGQDANFNEEIFISRYNSDLANDFGNLASRVATLIRKNYDSIIPAGGQPGQEERKLQADAQQTAKKSFDLINELRLNEAIETIIGFVKSINRYMEIRQPWKLVKQDKTSAGTVLYTATEGLRIAANLLRPVMPAKMAQLLAALPVGDPAAKTEWGNLKSGAILEAIPILFPRIQKEQAMQAKAEPDKSEAAKTDEYVSIEDFDKLKLATATVLSAEKVPGTSKLLKLQIDTGADRRQIVAGIAEYYQPDDLIGKTVVVITNLKPARIRGVASQGMLLAAQKGQKMTLVTTLEKIAAGAEIS